MKQNAEVDERGIVRFATTKQVPPDQALDQLEEEGLVFDRYASQVCREQERVAAVRNYRLTDATGCRRCRGTGSIRFGGTPVICPGCGGIGTLGGRIEHR